jgi:hypothetical protein
LAEVQRRLLELADWDVAEKHQLLKRRDGLRDMAARYHHNLDEERSDAEFLAELAAHRARLKSLEGNRIDLVSQAGGGHESPGGGSGWGGVDLNRQIDSAGGRDHILARIGRITSILTDRGVDYPQR